MLLVHLFPSLCWWQHIMPAILSILCWNSYFKCWMIREIWKSVIHPRFCHEKLQYRPNSEAILNNKEQFTLLPRQTMQLCTFLFSACFCSDTSTFGHRKKGGTTIIASPENPVDREKMTLSVKCSPLWRLAEALLISFSAYLCSKSFSTPISLQLSSIPSNSLTKAAISASLSPTLSSFSWDISCTRVT